MGSTGVDVAEVFSPPRVCAEALKFGLSAGQSMDLTTGWDFRKAEHRKLAEKYVNEVKPLLLIGSPMCTIFSVLQNLTDWTSEKQKRYVESVHHVEFVLKLYRSGTKIVYKN